METIFKLLLKKCGVRVRSGFTWLRIGPEAGCYKNGKENSGCIDSRTFLDMWVTTRFCRTLLLAVNSLLTQKSRLSDLSGTEERSHNRKRR